MTAQLEKEAFKLLASDYLLAHAPGHIYWKDLNGLILGCNQEQASSLGLKTPEDIIGKTNFDFFDDEIAQKLTDNDNKVIKEGQVLEIVEKLAGGQYVLSKKIPLRDKDGVIIGILGTSVDITKQVNVEAELQLKTQELAATIEARDKALADIELRDKVLTVVSHEIKNTVQGMIGLSEEVLIAWGRLKDDDKKLYLQDILGSRDRLTLFLDDLLEVPKLRSGVLKFNFSECNICELLKKISKEYSRSPTVVTLQISENLPQTAYCDQARVQQVLDNLLRNAVKHGGKDQEIFVSACDSEKSDGFIEITVHDQGVGIQPEEVDLVFESFYQSILTRKKKGGTGLGLSICKEIVNAHHGKIWIEPKQTKGAAFTFTIPKSADVHDRHADIEEHQAK